MTTAITNKTKTLIGVLASHDDGDKNNSLVSIIEELIREENRKVNEGQENILVEFGFVFTGGTFDRIFLRKKDPDSKITTDFLPLNIVEFLLDKCEVLRLPPGREGGVILLSSLVARRKISILWSFLSPKTIHWLKPENLALMRLCDQWSVKRLMNTGSVKEWFEKSNYPYFLKLLKSSALSEENKEKLYCDTKSKFNKRIKQLISDNKEELWSRIESQDFPMRNIKIQEIDINTELKKSKVVAWGSVFDFIRNRYSNFDLFCRVFENLEILVLVEGKIEEFEKLQRLYGKIKTRYNNKIAGLYGKTIEAHIDLINDSYKEPRVINELRNFEIKVSSIIGVLPLITIETKKIGSLLFS